MSQVTFHARPHAGVWHVHCFFLRDFVMNAERTNRGFSLVEMLVTVLVLGMVIAFSVPAFQSFGNTHRLHGATLNMSENLRVLREKAMATGQSQTMHFGTTPYPPGKTWLYHVHNGISVPAGWDLPRGITFQTIGINPTFDKTGRTTGGATGMIVLRNRRGERDTVNILASGMILVQ